VALIGEIVVGETPLTEQDLMGLKLPLVRTREQLNAVEGPNILSGRQWALESRTARIPEMLTTDYLRELHRRMFGDVWQWAGEVRTVELQNAFASPVSDIRPELSILYQDAVDYWLKDARMSADELAVRVHHRVVKVHPSGTATGATPACWPMSYCCGTSDCNHLRGVVELHSVTPIRTAACTLRVSGPPTGATMGPSWLCAEQHRSRLAAPM
jgi:fido (protein-threonine AMPylation protein)